MECSITANMCISYPTLCPCAYFNCCSIVKRTEMKVKIKIEVELSDGMELHHDDERIWAENEIFVGDGNLILYSNEIGDEVGVVKKIEKVTWIDDETQ